MAGQIEEFLARTKSRLPRGTNTSIKLHAVMGNESCDLDSAACAISLAYFLDATDDKKIAFFPVLNVVRSDYRLKTEVKYLLNKIGVKESSLVFKDDINLKALCSSGKLKISIVDFNTFPKEQEHFEKYLVQIIDHHSTQRKTNSKLKVIIEEVGSCASLITELMMNHKHFTMIEDVALLLYGAILVDTAFFNDKDRTTEKDSNMALKLKDFLKDLDSHKYFKELVRAKVDDEDLTQMEILMKDMKILKKSHWNKSVSIIVSVVHKSIFDFFSANIVIESTFFEFIHANKADVLIIMFLETLEDCIMRYLAVCSYNENLLKSAVAALREHTNPSLGLEDITIILATPSSSLLHSSGARSNMDSNRLPGMTSQLTVNSRLSQPAIQSTFLAFKQLNTSASRKVVIPLLEKHMDEFLKNM